MGTNYYWKDDAAACPTCGHNPGSELHIGKSSAGWVFSLNTHPEKGINNLNDWIVTWFSGSIRDEYGKGITPAEMLWVIMGRRGKDGWSPEALAVNHAIRGPRNLACPEADGRFCIAHGDGTYALMRGDFC